jgi:hypothetical protein
MTATDHSFGSWRHDIPDHLFLSLFLPHAGPRVGQLVADGDRARYNGHLRRIGEQPGAAKGCERSATARI